MSDRQSIVSDPEIIRARAMETLFERLETLCEGAIAIDRAGRVVYVKLGEALEKRGVAAHIFESAVEAQSDWRNVEGIVDPGPA